MAGQVFSGNENSNHFFGRWLNKAVTLEDYTPSITDLTPNSTSIPPNAVLQNALGTFSNVGAAYELQNATSKVTDFPPDGDFFIMRMVIQE